MITAFEVAASLFSRSQIVEFLFVASMSLLVTWVFLGLAFSLLQIRVNILMFTIGVAFLTVSSMLPPLALSFAHPVTNFSAKLLPRVDEAVVHYAYSLRKEKIFILLTWDGQDEPRLFEYPWTKQLEKQLQAALDQSERQTGQRKAIIKNPFTNQMRPQSRGNRARNGETTVDPTHPGRGNTNKTLNNFMSIHPLPPQGVNPPKRR
ncbi:MAG: hypothetical protein D6698_11645 [Gammaproteobacteria bacterium]|nr:MAG: hypothetical protein D6698_11645 [Gammaproteobacteria bacterium]